MDDFQRIYWSVTGNLIPECRVPWIESIWAEGSAGKQAYEDFWEAREHLCERFGMDWEDPDLELFMNGILYLQEDVAKRMFRYTLEYAKRGYKL